MPEALDNPSEAKPCYICGLELNHGQVHISIERCVKDMRERIVFLRGVTLGQAKELDWERTAIKATHRVAYILLNALTKGKSRGRAKLPRTAFEKIPEGAGITMTELDNGDFEVVGVLPDVKEKVAS